MHKYTPLLRALLAIFIGGGCMFLTATVSAQEEQEQPWSVFNDGTGYKFPGAVSILAPVSPVTRLPLPLSMCMSSDYKNAAVCYRPLNEAYEFRSKEQFLFRDDQRLKVSTVAATHLGNKEGYMAFWTSLLRPGYHTHDIQGRFVTATGALPTEPVTFGTDGSSNIAAEPLGDGRVALLYQSRTNSKWRLRIVSVDDDGIPTADGPEIVIGDVCAATCRCYSGTMGTFSSNNDDGDGGGGFVAFAVECHRHVAFSVSFELETDGTSTSIVLGSENQFLRLEEKASIWLSAVGVNSKYGALAVGISTASSHKTRFYLVDKISLTPIGSFISLALTGAIWLAPGALLEGQQRTIIVYDATGAAQLVDINETRLTGVLLSPNKLSSPQIPSGKPYYTRHFYVGGNSTFFTMITSTDQTVYARLGTPKAISGADVVGLMTPSPKEDTTSAQKAHDADEDTKSCNATCVVAISTSIGGGFVFVVVVILLVRHGLKRSNDEPSVSTHEVNVAAEQPCRTENRNSVLVLPPHAQNTSSMEKAPHVVSPLEQEECCRRREIELPEDRYHQHHHQTRRATTTTTTTDEGCEMVPAREGRPTVSKSDESCCVVCLTNTKRIAFVPCGHVCCCERCGESLETCPICRSAIALKQKVFF